MGLFSRKSGSGSRSRQAQTREYFSEFVASRDAVEGYFEEATDREPAALVLVASTGEWTRRKVPSVKDASKLCQDLDIPCYEVARSGYPRAMREWNLNNPGSSMR